MNLRRIASRTISEINSAAHCLSTPRQGFRVLMYHAVGTPADRDRLGLYSITPSLFASHMHALAEFSVCSINDFADHAESALRVAVTFDDGYKDNLYHAAPILLQLGIPFAVFVSTGFTRSAHPSFLSPSELKELANWPKAVIGTHGSTHTPLTACNDDTLKNELQGSKKYLEDILGKPVDTMSYPFGAVDMRVRAAVEAAGYSKAFSSRFDINIRGRDPLLLCRTDIVSMDSVRVLTQKLRGAWDWYRWRNPDPALA